MRKKLTILGTSILGASIAIVFTASCVRSAMSQGSTPEIATSLRTERGTTKTGAPITVLASLTNRSNHEITLGYDRARGFFDVDVLDENGKFAPDKRPGYYNGRIDLERFARTATPEEVAKSGLLTGHLAWVTIKAGETFSQNIGVDKYYEMTKPGVYKIVVQRADPATARAVRSNAAEVTVTK